ncbi:hypothetical protein ABT095_06850 [Kitasatospora sp. NPDC002227]|uniref:hypothetical protein n=1 Tax=Kitasatospora sp. NPDC002227 TaxID=3154773 RepID=UPI003327D736
MTSLRPNHRVLLPAGLIWTVPTVLKALSADDPVSRAGWWVGAALGVAVAAACLVPLLSVGADGLRRWRRGRRVTEPLREVARVSADDRHGTPHLVVELRGGGSTALPLRNTSGASRRAFLAALHEHLAPGLVTPAAEAALGA